jgi:hypothetical protein
MTDAPRCHRCKFWVQEKGNKEQVVEDQLGDCRRHPPRAVPWAAIDLDLEHVESKLARNACWQTTFGSDWCGEFEAKESTPR